MIPSFKDHFIIKKSPEVIMKRFQLTKAAHVIVSAYNALGEKVKTLIDEDYRAKWKQYTGQKDEFVAPGSF